MLKYLRVILLMGSLLTALNSQGQVYTGDNFPVVGSNYGMFVDSSIGYDITESMLTASPPWYFPQVGYDYVDTVNFEDPLNMLFASHFIGSTLAVSDSFMSDFLSASFLTVVSGNYYSLGGIVIPPSGQPIPLVYENPSLWLQLPIQIGANSATSANGTLLATGPEVGVPADSVMYKRSVVTHDTVDATGHLTLPGLILDNAIRRIRTDSIADSMFVKVNDVWSFSPNEGEGATVERFVEWYHADNDWLVAQAYIKNNQVYGMRYIPGPPPTIRLEFSALPSDVSIIDSIASFTVSAYDIATEALATDFSDSIRINTFQDTSGGGWGSNWSVNEHVVAANNGVGTFTGLRFYSPGTYRLLAWSDTVLADTSTFILVHPVATYLELDASSHSIQANDQIPTLTVSALNDSGYVDNLFYQGSVRVGKISGPGELTGTYTQPLINGVAIFDDLRITDNGEYQLVFYAPLGQGYIAQDTLTVYVNSVGDWAYSHTDTLSQYYDRAQQFVWFGNADGYLSGTSRGGYSEVGQHFDFVGRGRITSVICHFANRYHVGDDSDVFELKVYDAGLAESNYGTNNGATRFMDSIPLTLLGSQLFAADSMNFGDFWIQHPTTIRFENPPAVNSSFIISLVGDSELSNDTIMLWHSIIGDGQQEYRTVRLLTGFSAPVNTDTFWIRDKYWRPSFDVDLMMIPIIELDTLNTITHAEIRKTQPADLTAFPNPTEGVIRIEWKGIDDAYTIETYSNAQIVDTQSIYGRSSQNLDLRLLSPGSYFICIRNGDGRLLGSKTIIKK